MAYEFNGSTQYLSTASAPVTAVPLTIACWFYANNATTNMRLGGIYQNASNNICDFHVQGANAGDPIAISINNSNTFETTSSTTGFSANTWHHACAVFAATNSRTIYLDAGGAATGTLNIPNPSGLNTINVARRTDFGSLFNGRIAEFGIWSAALTQPEIASLADGMTCDKVRPQSLVAYFPLVRDLVELKGGLTVTNNNTATVANHPRVYA